ncbi:MAG: hypothetical protein IKV53_00215 [Clostridia bacterium]|nr:hypothetical protein [Clostridia bacterium]
MNIFFADNKDMYKSSFVDSCPGFTECRDNEEATVDVLIVDGGANLDRFRQRRVNTCLCPSSRYFDVIASMRVNSAVSCGMRERDSVTFSSIGEESAMVCLKRRVNFLDREFDPCEFKVPFDRGRGLYANLALGTLEYFVKNYGEL